jgi:anaerobic magnesium-protoporphyrin IX monomethyl ester cyclase
VLKLMNKRHQRVNEMYETARKANLAGIRVTFNLIFAYPGETEADRTITFQTMSDIARQFPNVSFSPNIFTPYPGIPIWPQLRELGVPEPHSLRGMDGDAAGRQYASLAKRERNWRGLIGWWSISCSIARYAGRRKLHSRLRQAVQSIIRSPIRWRLNSNRCSFPWELWLAALSERLLRAAFAHHRSGTS